MPETIIYHIDVNAAFLSWQACSDISIDENALDIRTIPAVVGGNQEERHGIVLAKSTPAKAYHIRTGEPLVNARKKCPHLTIVPPNFPLYVEKSNAFIELLKKHSPIVEQYSIDEAFCDMSGMEKLHGNPIAFAHTLREEIKNVLGFTVNIGVSSNKLLAKMASDFTKPDRVHTLFPDEIQTKLWPLPIEDLFYVGKSTSQKLRFLGIKTIGELAKSDPEIIKSHFKKHGEVIWNYANGIDTDILKDRPEPNKGYGNSITTHFDITDSDTALKIILSLCETVGARIRADNVYISVVSVTLVDFEFHHTSKQMTLPSSTNVTEKIFEAASALFGQAWNKTPLRLLGVSTSHASTERYEQYNLFDMEKYEKLSKLNTAIDSIRSRYGEDSVKRACFINSETGHMGGGLQKAKRERKN
ncbi:DNA polymerase IV [bacterium 1xD8-6]|jgi:Nucleotidyltransferase/DNA polymerase involved in DNA repair|nr:DNA polymerase IV [bacterium D16-36]RKI69285.1 DNA polymerase IV [bacterium 1xD8-6]